MLLQGHSQPLDGQNKSSGSLAACMWSCYAWSVRQSSTRRRSQAHCSTCSWCLHVMAKPSCRNSQACSQARLGACLPGSRYSLLGASCLPRAAVLLLGRKTAHAASTLRAIGIQSHAGIQLVNGWGTRPASIACAAGQQGGSKLELGPVRQRVSSLGCMPDRGAGRRRERCRAGSGLRVAALEGPSRGGTALTGGSSAGAGGWRRNMLRDGRMQHLLQHHLRQPACRHADGVARELWQRQVADALCYA